MTLIEVLVGLTVTGVALSIGYGALTSVVDRRDRAAEVADEIARAGAVRQMITSWLDGARVTVEQSGPQFRGLDGTYQGMPDDELAFLTTSFTPLGAGEHLVRLYVDRSEETPERGLVASITEWRGSGRTRVTVDSVVAGMDVRYYSGLLGARRWLPSWISTSVLPVAVEVRFEAAESDSLPALLRLPVFAALAGGR